MIKEQLYTEFNFYLTDEQKEAIVNSGISLGELSFSAKGMVFATVWDEYDVRCYTFRKDGSVIVEERGLDSDGWQTRVDQDGNPVIQGELASAWQR